MGNRTHLEILKNGKEEWNNWINNKNIHPDFSGFVLDGLDLQDFHLDNSYFYESSLRDCNLNQAWLSWCTFIKTPLTNSSIINPERENYTDKRMMGVNLRWSTFSQCDLQNVNLIGASMEGVRFHGCNFKGANISESDVFGIAAWGNEYDQETKQHSLYITEYDEPTITVDSLEIAPLLYMLINNKNIRETIDTLATKVVLILGSFAKNDKPFLNEIKMELRNRNYVPVMYDFDKPNARNHTETVSTIAHLSKFIVANLTNQRSIPHELATLIPQLRSVLVIPIIQEDQSPYGMFDDFSNLQNVSPIISYNIDDPLTNLIRKIMSNANSYII